MIEHFGKEKPYIGKEANFQTATATWLASVLPKPVAHHTPNGGSRHPIEAANLKRQGTKPGVPDWLIFDQKHGYSGLAIELKVKKGILSAHQELYLELLSKVGWKVVVIWNFDEFLRVVSEYLDLKSQSLRLH